MYLLNRTDGFMQIPEDTHLHSTMYLLNQPSIYFTPPLFCSFTFHYVSIKSLYSRTTYTIQQNLHSTMYLLNRAGGQAGLYK